MNRITAAVVLLTVSVGLGVGSHFLIENSTTEMIEAMKNDRELTMQACEASAERAEDIQELWKSNENILVTLLPHSELDEIEMAIKSLTEFQRQGLNEEYIKALDDCINRLEHINESEMTNLKNIF